MNPHVSSNSGFPKNLQIQGIQGTFRQGPPGTGIMSICRLQWKAHRIATAWAPGHRAMLRPVKRYVFWVVPKEMGGFQQRLRG